MSAPDQPAVAPSVVRIEADWDSGPYGTWAETSRALGARGQFSGYVYEVPRGVWETYEAAVKVLRAAEDMLGYWEQLAIASESS